MLGNKNKISKLMVVSFYFFEPATVPWLNFSGDAPFNYVLLCGGYTFNWCACYNIYLSQQLISGTKVNTAT